MTTSQINQTSKTYNCWTDPQRLFRVKYSNLEKLHQINHKVSPKKYRLRESKKHHPKMRRLSLKCEINTRKTEYYSEDDEYDYQHKTISELKKLSAEEDTEFEYRYNLWLEGGVYLL